MKHFGSRQLYAHWDQARADAPAAARRAIDPAAVPRILGDMFILDAGSFNVRLAGTRLCAIFGRELRGTSFLDLWTHDRAQIALLLTAVRANDRVAIAEASARPADGRPAPFELLLLPLVQAGPGCDRILGLLAPLAHPAWLGLDPVADLTPGDASLIWPADGSRVGIPPQSQPEPEPTLPAVGWRRDRFVVFAGGKTG